jgi:hypothetical protein
MFSIETYLVDAFTTFAAMRRLVAPSEALEVINSVIKGTVSLAETREWNKKVMGGL